MNKFGVGTKAYVFTHTDSAGIINKKMQYEELMLTRGFQSSSDTKLHFGLDSVKTIDSILIVWSNQKYQLIKNVPANKPLIVYQKNAADSFHYNSFFLKKRNFRRCNCAG